MIATRSGWEGDQNRIENKSLSRNCRNFLAPAVSDCKTEQFFLALLNWVLFYALRDVKFNSRIKYLRSHGIWDYFTLAKAIVWIWWGTTANTRKKFIKTAINLIEVSNDQWFDKVTIKLSKRTIHRYFCFSSFSFWSLYCEFCITSIECSMLNKKNYFEMCFI